MDQEFREKLVDTLGKLASKKETEYIQDDNQFIEALSWSYRVGTVEWLLEETEEPFIKLVEKLQSLSEQALSNEGNAFSFAYFLFLSDTLLMPYFQPWATEWVGTARTQYPTDYRLSYIYAYAVTFSFTFLKDLGGNLPNVPPGTEALKITSDAVRTNPQGIIAMVSVYLRQRQVYYEQYPALMQLSYDVLKTYYPDVPPESIHSALLSVEICTLAEYYLIAGDRTGFKKTVGDALSLWPKNSFALALSAHGDTLNGNLVAARQRFLEAEALAMQQFNGLPLKVRNLVSIYLGLSYCFYREGLYEESVQYCTQALNLNPEPMLRAAVLLNRGRSLLEKDDLEAAYMDFEAVLAYDGQSPGAHLNLGLLFYKRGVYETAKEEYHVALRGEPNLAEAYNNLGLIYADEGKPERARKLFEAACRLDSSFSKAKDNLEKMNQKSARDWWDWWFGTGTSSWRKALGIALVLLVLAEVVLGGILVCKGKDISNALLGMMGLTALFLILPAIKKLEVGPLKFESESKGERPVVG